jgi:hypothetical protein
MNAFESFLRAAHTWYREAARFSGAWRTDPSDPRRMVELMRPTLGSAPPPLRRLLEPVVAASAAAAVVTLLGLGVASFTLFLLAGALIYAILTKVFGLELGVEMPRP